MGREIVFRAVEADERGLGVEGVNMTWTAHHEEKDARLGLGGQRRHRVSCGGRTESAVAGQHVGHGGAEETVASLAEEFPP